MFLPEVPTGYRQGLFGQFDRLVDFQKVAIGFGQVVVGDANVKKKSALNIMMWNLLVLMKCLNVLCGGGDDDNREPFSETDRNRHFAFVHL